MHKLKFSVIIPGILAMVILFSKPSVMLSVAPGNLPEPLPSPVSVVAGENGIFSILTITDLHFFAQGVMADPPTVNNIKRMIRKFSPDMVMVTGDMWNNNPDGRGKEFLKWSASTMGKLDIPWAFAWGNHDSLDDRAIGHAILDHAPNSLYRGGASNGNYRIAVTDASGAPLWNLIILDDSHGMGEEQLDWFRNEVEIIKKESSTPPPALLFFHIPLLQYDEIVTGGLAHGVKNENVCFDGDNGEAFSVFRDSGMVKAMFCGHDHVNDYSGEIDGVKMVYVRATGVGGYGSDKVMKGGTLITIDTSAGTYDFVSVMPDGSTWTPDGFTENK